MKKSKFLVPILGTATLVSAFIPLASCKKNNKKKEETIVSETDKKYVNSVNDKIARYQWQIDSPHKAVDVASSLNFDIEAVNMENGCEIGWDMSTKRFIILKDDEVVYQEEESNSDNPYDIWKFVSEYDAKSSISQCLKDDFDESITSLTIKTGFDMGNVDTITDVIWDGIDHKAKDVLVVTHSNSFTVNSYNDKITHLGGCNNVIINKTEGNTDMTFIEGGQIAYLSTWTKNIGFTKNKTSTCSVDLWEPRVSSTIVQNDSSLNKVYGVIKEEGITITVAEGVKAPSYTEVTPQIPENMTSLYDMLTDTTKSYQFIRLKYGTTYWIKDLAKQSIIIKSKLAIDFNGATITDDGCTKYTTDESSQKNVWVHSSNNIANERISIEPTAQVNLMDTNHVGTSGLHLEDFTINVYSDANNGAYLLLNGAYIYYVSSNDKYYSSATASSQSYSNRGAIRIRTKSGVSNPVESIVKMYGGVIKSEFKDIEHADLSANNAIGISPGTGSYVAIYYGAIYADTQCLGSNSSNDESYVDIINGRFISKNDVCIYLPQDGEFNIFGGYFEGLSCIGLKAGELNISGGEFYAYGDYMENPTSHGSSSDVDGSVICFDANYTYDVDPVLNVSNSTMWSKNGHIVRGVSLSNQKKPVVAYCTFAGGKFYYGHADKDDSTTPGIQLEDYDSTTTWYIDQAGGVWTKLEV